METSETVVSGIRYWVEHPAALAPPRLAGIAGIMAQRVRTTPEIHSLFYINALGRKILSEPFSAKSTTYTDREYFQAHGAFVLSFSQRVDNPDGSFGGVVLAAITLSYVDDLYAKFDLGENGLIGLVREDGTILARRPFLLRSIGSDQSKSAVFAHIGQQKEGSFVERSELDGVERLYAFRKLDSFGIYTFVGIPTQDIYGAWRQASILNGILALVVVVVLVALALLLCREIDSRERASRHLALMAFTDGLTGVANRRHFDSVLEQEWNHAIASGLPIGLILVDVDHFKRYNDRYGHLAGDDALRTVVSRIAGCELRSKDLPARVGGEEFVVLLPETQLAGAELVAERIRRDIAAAAIAHADGEHGILTVSIGVATFYPLPGSRSADLMHTADEALYEAKRDGRNCVRTAAVVRDAPSVSLSHGLRIEKSSSTT